MKGEISLDNLSELIKSFTNETRLRILILLYQKELCVCEIQGVLDKPQPLVSKQLAILKSFDLLKDVKKDKYVYYSLKENKIINDFIKVILENKENYPFIIDDLKKCENSHVYREGKC